MNLFANNLINSRFFTNTWFLFSNESVKDFCYKSWLEKKREACTKNKITSFGPPDFTFYQE